MNEEWLKAALTYASRGWLVFPLQPDNGDGKTLKEPAVEWKTKATTDLDQIKTWFAPSDYQLPYGIGIAAGNGVSILDVDTKSQGIETLDAFANEEDLETPTVVTPTGGMHLYYQTPEDREVKNWVKFLPGLDLRTDGGYVVAPPTTRDGKPYRWEISAKNTPMRPLPEWVKKYPKQGQGDVKGYQDTDWIVPGEWNTRMVSIAGVEVHQAHSEEELAARLLAISETRSHPDHRSHSEDDMQRLDRIAHDAWEQWRRKVVLYEQTEEGQAEFFSDMFRKAARYNWATRQWMVWKGQWWELDAGGKVRTLITDAYRQRLANAKAAFDLLPADMSLRERMTKLEAKELSFARAMGSWRAQESVWNLSRKQLGSKKIEWDTDPFLIGVSNGVVDLRTGELFEGKPEQMISKHIDLEYKPANCFATRWRKFVLEIFGGDAEMVDFFQRALGYSMTGLTREQVWFLCYGPGSNGKSTAFEDILLKYIFGPYGQVSRIDTFTVRRNRTGISNDEVELDGARFVLTSEPAGWAELDEERIKTYTTGGRVKARNLNEKNKEFTPVLKLWMTTNHLPKVTDLSDGMKRRILQVPFMVQFGKPGNPPININIVPDLTAEKEHILVWIVEGAVKYLTDGLKTPLKVIEATKEYLADEDVFGQWVNDSLEAEDGVRSKTEELYKSFRSWHLKRGSQDRFIPGIQGFAKTLRERFPTTYKNTGKERVWMGLRLADRELVEVGGPTY